MIDPTDDRPTPPPIHVPRQARSRETLTRLLDAAEAVLREGGLEAATVPAIAERAGLSVGAVYRRFPDKDGLLRAVHDRTLHRFREMNDTKMAPELFAGATLSQWVAGMIRGLLFVYRQDRRLMQAMQEFAETHADPAFRARAADTNRAALERFTALLTSKAAEVSHPHPETAARFALLTIGLILRRLVLAGQPAPGLELGDNVSLEDELTRLVLGYLGVTADQG